MLNIWSNIFNLLTNGFIIEEYNENEPLLPENNIHTLLVISSACFLLSGVIAFMNNIWVFVVISFITSCVSMNHWRDVQKGPRRTADLICAKISFLIFFLSGCFAIETTMLWCIAVPICITMFIL
jgi:hypothetical protein